MARETRLKSTGAPRPAEWCEYRTGTVHPTAPCKNALIRTPCHAIIIITLRHCPAISHALMITIVACFLVPYSPSPWNTKSVMLLPAFSVRRPLQRGCGSSSAWPCAARCPLLVPACRRPLMPTGSPPPACPFLHTRFVAKWHLSWLRRCPPRLCSSSSSVRGRKQPLRRAGSPLTGVQGPCEARSCKLSPCRQAAGSPPVAVPAVGAPPLAPRLSHQPYNCRPLRRGCPSIPTTAAP